MTEDGSTSIIGIVIDGAYLRFAGELRVQRIVDDRVVEEFTDEALWELMYFGHARGEAEADA